MKEARNYSPIGCIELSVIGAWPRCNAGYLNLLKILELTLFDGVDQDSGERVGIPTGNPATFNTFDKFINAFKLQMKHAVKLLVLANNLVDEMNKKYAPYPFISCLVPDCIESALDVTSGGARYNWTGPLGIGLANTGNSVYNIKKLVYDEKKISLAEMINALKNNYVGFENLQREMLNLPKYGNDVDEVDEMTSLVAEIFFDEVDRYENTRNGKFYPGLYSLTSNISLGKKVCATPDGRKAGEAMAEGISPTQGSDHRGPTAVFKSVSKIDLVRATNGVILNQKINPNLLKKHDEVLKFANLCRTFLCDLKGLHVQFNVITKETLVDAQLHPEKYRDLLIRVTGYSAFFTQLAVEVQNDIIKRTEAFKIM